MPTTITSHQSVITMTTEPSRLDQIESLLLQTATNLNSVSTRLDKVAEQQAVNTQAINNLTVKVDNLTVKVDDLTADVDVLRDYFLQTIQNAEEDREAWKAEIRRIWEYLRDRNGGSPIM